MTESLVIMQILDSNFPGPQMIPEPDSPQFKEANELLGLERKLFGAWCSLVFRPSGGIGGFMGGGAKGAFEAVMDK